MNRDAILTRQHVARRLTGGLWLAFLLVAPAGLTAMLRFAPALDPLYESVDFHLVVVSAIAAAALLVAVPTTMAAARAKEPSLVLLALGCMAVGVFMLGHGLTTPGVAGRPFNMWVGRLPVLGIAAFGACLAAAARRGGRLNRWVARRPVAWLALPSAASLMFVAALVIWPTAAFGDRPIPFEGPISQAVVLTSGVILLLTGMVHWGRWHLGRDRVQLALAAAAWLSADAVVSFKLGIFWRLSWWDYHAYLLAGFGAAVYAVTTGYRRTRSVEATLKSVSLADPLDHISHGYPETLQALVAAVEAKDRYTHGHSARVAELTTRVGQRLGLDNDTLRRLAQGAFLHDIGKIGVPDQVLNKPAELTPEEWVWIRQHPVAGAEIAGRAPSLKPTLEVIRHHHERWDGSGYPDGLARERIPLVARIIAVADVWDALTSDRAYRPAWKPERALAHIIAGRGAHFDPACVDAFVALMAERGIGPADEGSLEEVDRAADHHGRRRSEPARRSG